MTAKNSDPSGPARNEGGLSRRSFLARAVAAGIFAPGVLAACTSDSKDTGSGSDAETGDSTSAGAETSAAGETGTAATPTAAAAKGSGKVRIASWPFYIENDQDPKSSPTIKKFTETTGIDVDYQIAIEDNVSFTEKFKPDLEAGKSIGFDIALPTSWMAARWIKAGWVEEIPVDKVPNRVNVLDRLANPPWDPGRKYTLPFTIGQVGIAYYPEKIGFEITSMKDFLKPELKGKVTLLSEMRDSVGLFLLMMGVKPEEATVEQAQAAIAEIKKYRDQGHFKKITGNSYTEDLNLGDTWAAVAWSGDVAAIQKDKPDLKWTLPSDGAMSFMDTLVIPKGGDVESAAAWMNYLYDPTVSGPLFEAISYSSPVKGAGDAMSPTGKANPLVNPPADANIHEFRDLTAEEADELEAAFAAATQQ